MKTTEIKNLKKGAFFRKIRNGAESKETWIKGEYDRTEKAFLCTSYEDINKWCYIKANKLVSYDFIF